MIRRLALIAVTLLLLLVPASVGANNLAQYRLGGELMDTSPGSELRLAVTGTQAEAGITVLASDVEIDFPRQAMFTLEAESSADIVDVRLCYQVDKMKYAEVVSEGWADFTPATRIDAGWVWDMRQASLPTGAEVIYWWVIKDAEGTRLETYPETMHFDDDRYVWQSLTSSGFVSESQISQGDELTVFWYEGGSSFARDLMDVCEAGLTRLTEEIGTHPERPIKIYIYASASDLQGAMIFPQEWTGGVAFPEFSTIAIGIPPGRLDWGKRALVHELTHLVVYQATFGPYGRLPTWLDEGLATYNEGELTPSLRSSLERAILEDELISVLSLCGPFSAETEKARLSYAQSYSLVEYLLDNYGQDKMLELLTLFQQGSTHDEALTEVYGFDLDGLDANWRATLSAGTVIGSGAWESHPVLPAVLAALAVVAALGGVLVLRKGSWRRSSPKFNEEDRL
ncbi:MAG: peptidase MA family metallohydrolase [Dehalococcoidia bacterium]